jgi:hypothetical protein
MNGSITTKPRDGWLLVALAAWSVHYFFKYGGTAYEWPALDIVPLVARNLDPAFLTNDFFTNASAEANPRHVFGFLVAAVARGFSGDWYPALFLLRIVAVVFLPVMWYLALTGFVRQWSGDRRRADGTQFVADQVASNAAIVVGILLVVRPIVSAWFSIAWWPPFHAQATAANYSLLFALGGSVLLQGTVAEQSKPWCAACGIAAWFAASLLHPAVSLFVIVFHGIATFDRWRARHALAVLAASWLLPCATVALVCQPAVSISAEQFIHDYVIVRHPSHYWPAAFGSLTEKPWWHSFYLVTGLLLSAVLYAALRRDRRLATLGLLMTGAYVGAVGLQYVAVVLWPNKLLAALGPVRYSALGYFAYVLMAALVAADAAAWLAARAKIIGRAWDNVEQATKRILLGRKSALVLLGAAAIVLGITQRDNPFAQRRAENGPLLDWIADKTPTDSVVAAADDFVSVDVALIARRATLVGIGFPFREDFFAEHTFREALLFGTLEDRTELRDKASADAPGDDGRIAYFRQLRPKDFAAIAEKRQLDYVIVEAEHAAAFDGITPAFADPRWRVYPTAAHR